MTFTYTISFTLDTVTSLPPVAGSEEQRAYWVAPDLLAWPMSLLPRGMNREKVVTDSGRPVPGTGLAFQLVTAPEGGAAAVHGRIVGADGLAAPTLTPLRVVGNLPESVRAAHPNLEGYIALSPTDSAGTPLLDDDAIAAALTGQVAIAQHVDANTDGNGGRLDAFTGVQTAIILDRLYAEAASRADLGVTFSDGSSEGPDDGSSDNADAGRPSFALWAPTAKTVTLLTWQTGDPLGSVPEVPGPATRTPAIQGDDGRWCVPNADGRIGVGCQYLWEVKVYVPSTRRVETNIVTDPYSTALTTDSTRSPMRAWRPTSGPPSPPRRFATTPPAASTSCTCATSPPPTRPSRPSCAAPTGPSPWRTPPVCATWRNWRVPG